MNDNKFILVTSGEPAGIGPEICLDLAFFSCTKPIIVLADMQLLQSRACLLNKAIKFNLMNNFLDNYSFTYGVLNVLHINCPNHDCIGSPQLANANYVIAMLDQAIKLCNEKYSNIVVTAPLNKDIINTSGLTFSGHTEYLAEKFKVAKVVMMLSNPELNVALLTTHLPLKDVSKHITTTTLNQTLDVIYHSFEHNFNIKNPRIAVCGLNPHAGEGGYLGTEEIEIINPVIKNWQSAGYNIFGSFPADTIFNKAKDYDLILAMYHDQGLPVVKYSDFINGVNTTLGLPIIRTSVDHGTALDIAGKGVANSQSLISAINFAIKKYH